MDLQNALNNYLKDRQLKIILPATVTKVTESNLSCSVVDMEGIELFEVMIQCHSENPLQIIPSVGSNVLIGRIGDSEQWSILVHSEISKFEIPTEGTIFRVQNDGIVLQKEGDSLRSMISDLIESLVSLVLITPAGNGSISPADVASLNALGTRFKNLLEDA